MKSPAAAATATATASSSSSCLPSLPSPHLHFRRLRRRAVCAPRGLSEKPPSRCSAVVTSQAGDRGVSSVPVVTKGEIGVLLLNLGGPETLDDVQPFLFNLFADPDIIRLPRLFRFLQRPPAQFISVKRATKSKEGYASIGGGSPLRKITDSLAEELRKSLWEKNVPAKVYVDMRYWHPFTEEAIEQEIMHSGANIYFRFGRCCDRESSLCWCNGSFQSGSLTDGIFLRSLAPLGSLEELLAAYESRRRELPPPLTV